MFLKYELEKFNMKKSIIFLILLLPLLILSCSSSNDDEINQLQSQIIELENQKIQQELDELRKEKAEAEAEDLSVRKLFAIQNPIDTNIENCDSLFSNSKAYRYLPESVENFVTPNKLTTLFKKIGFQNLKTKNMSFGITTIVYAQK